MSYFINKISFISLGLDTDLSMHILDNSQTLTPLIWWHQLYLRVCLVMYNLLAPLARVRLSKHDTTKTTTMYRSLRIEENVI